MNESTRGADLTHTLRHARKAETPKVRMVACAVQTRTTLSDATNRIMSVLEMHGEISAIN